jgi:heme exporter protein C
VSSSDTNKDLGFHVLVAITAIGTVATLAVIFLKAPTEASMGIVQKIFYFHVPSAYAMYVGALVCFFGSAMYLWKGTTRWDALARAGAEVAVCMGMMMMTSGPLWALKAWGVAWTWDPRLTTSLLSLLIYVAYVILRGFAAGGEAERRFAAALGVLGAANLPIIHYSVQKWGGQHPKVVSSGGGGLQHPDMKLAFAMGSITFLFIAAVLIWHRMRVHMAVTRVDALEQEALELGLAGE